MFSQDERRALWLQAPEGKLCGREQAKAWALREVWRAEGKGDYGMYLFIVGKVKKMSRAAEWCVARCFRCQGVLRKNRQRSRLVPRQGE